MINAEQLDSNVSFSKIFKLFEAECDEYKTEANKDYYYFSFISWLEKNRYKNYKKIFLKETTLEDFIMFYFLEFPIGAMYDKIMFHDEIVRIVNRHITEIHSNIDMLCKLMSFHKIPRQILDMYDEIIPNYFDKSNPKRNKFLRYLFTYQEVPQKYFSKSLDFIKSNKDILDVILFSSKSRFYMDNIFNSNPCLYRELRAIAS